MGHGLRDTMTERANDLGGRAGELTSRAYAEAAPHVERVAETAAPLVGAAVVKAAPLVESVSDALETSLVRTGAALDALRGGPVAAPVGVRRWPWAVTAAVVGAAAGAAAALLVGRLIGQDAPDAQAPEDVEAVVDRPVDRPATGSANGSAGAPPLP